MIRAANVAALTTAALTLLLLGLRGTSIISLNVPLHVVTSGYEQESLLAIWERINGRAVYVSRWDEPFRWAIYNWLYYEAYSAIVASILYGLSLSDQWLPTISRSISFLGAFSATLLAYRAFGLARNERANDNVQRAALSIFVGVGPLVGYWSLTTRPDIWATALEITAVVVFLYNRKSRPILALFLFCIISYAAWAFKQSNVTAVAAIGGLLFLRMQWRDLLILVVSMVSAWAATLALGSEAFRVSVLILEYQTNVSFSNSLRIIFAVLPKVLPLAFGIGAIAVLLVIKPQIRHVVLNDDVVVLAALGFGAGAALAFLTSAQPGAAENYYFTTAFFAAFFIYAAIGRIREHSEIFCNTTWMAVGVGWGLQALALAAVLFGVIGTTSLRHFDAYHREIKGCLDALPRPLFVDNHYLSLPWMSPGNPSYVLAFGYAQDRISGREHYKGNGIGGKIARQEFATLVFTNPPGQSYDGASLSGYKSLESSCKELYVFQRRIDS